MTVRQNLHLNMPRSCDKMLHIHRVISKSLLRLRLGQIEILLKILRPLHHAHTLSAAAENRLNHNGIPRLFSLLHTFGRIKNSAFAAGNNGNAGLLHRIAGLLLIPHPGHNLSGRTDKANVTLLTQSSKLTVFRQKPIPRMNRIRARHNRSADNPFHSKIAFRESRRTDTDSLIRQLCMDRLPIRLRVHGNRLNPHLPARPNNAYCDFSPVCNQNLSNHSQSPIPVPQSPSSAPLSRSISSRQKMRL